MTSNTTPSSVLPEELVKQIRKRSADSEALGQLHPEILELIYQHRWFHLFVPYEFGGLNLGLPEALRLEEALAWIDGSVGWTVTLCSGASWFIGFLTPDTAASIFKDPLACLAGSGSIGGVAVPTESGYQISGHWSHATGAPHATIFTANCKIEKGDQPSISEEGEPLVRPFWFWRGEVSVEANWKTIGMIATSSNSFSIDALSVPQERCFEIDPGKAILPHLVFRFPFQQFAEATLAVNSAGMARHFIDCCEKLVRYRNSESPMSIVLSQKMNQAQEDLELARASFYRTVSEAWTALEEEQEVSQSIFQQVSLVSRHLAAIARELVDGLYPYCGLYAANPETMINRIWRDLHTASQHSLLHKIS